MDGYIKIRAWHVIRTWTRMPGVAVTLCGKRAHGPSAADFGSEATCESCLRIARKRGLV